MLQYVKRRLLLHVQNLTHKGVCKIKDSIVILISGKENMKKQSYVCNWISPWDTGTTESSLLIAVHEELGM